MIPKVTICLMGFFIVSHGTSISNLNVIFETFSPTSMVRFFEFNDVGWNITEKCIKDMFLYLDGLHKDILWAAKRKLLRNCFFFLIEHTCLRQMNFFFLLL